MNIALDIIQHRGSSQIAIRFKYNVLVKDYIKKFPGVRWSATHKCFYLLYKETNHIRLITYLEAQNWIIDTSGIKAFEEKQQVVKKYIQKYEKVVSAFGNWMAQKRYSHNTINTYTSMIKVFLRYYPDKNMDDITEKDIITFNQNYILARGYSTTFQNQLINALKLFYRKYKNEHLDLKNLERPLKTHKLPVILSLEEVQCILNATNNLKHKVLLSLVYSAGLRIGEALNLTLKDIDSQRMLLHIQKAKGMKDRYVPLSPGLLPYLRRYYLAYKTKEYLFEGQKGGRYTQVSARQLFKRLVKKCGITKRVTLHTLRHSYATHLLEDGTDIRYIQELLGHNSPKTTMIYTHVSTRNLQNIKSPFEKLDLKQTNDNLEKK